MTFYALLVVSLLVTLCRCGHNFTIENNGQDPLTGLVPLYEPAEDWNQETLIPRDSDENPRGITNPVDVTTVGDTSKSNQMTVLFSNEGKKRFLHLKPSILWK